LANFGKEGKPEPIIAKISQETFAEMIGTVAREFLHEQISQTDFIRYTAKLFAEAQKQPAVKRTAAELSRWRQALAKLIAATYPAKRYRPTTANL
jgi:uncharacterized damage-inducible protein DinB